MNRFNQLSPIEAIPTDTSRRKKLVATVSNPAGFISVRIQRRGQLRRWKVAERHSDVEVTGIDEIEVDNPFMVCRTTSCPPSSANSFERRALFALAKPPMNYFTKAFSHFPFLIKSSVHAIGAATIDRDTLTYAIVAVVDPSSSEVSEYVVKGKRSLELSHSNPTVDEAIKENIEFIRQLALKLGEARSKAEAPKRAFGIEDMVRKNSAATAGNIPLYISGQMVCPMHPSFVNMSRIAEMTLGRLISSLSDTPQQPQVPPQQVPVPVGTLFQYCALFRKKYPAVFTSQQKINKPSMPAPRAQGNPHQQANRIVTRLPPQPAQKPAPPSVPTPLPQTPSEPVSAPASVTASASSNWLRTSQRQKRAPSNPGSKAPPSPNPESPPKSAEAAFMVAGGPSLYGQFNDKSRQGR